MKKKPAINVTPDGELACAYGWPWLDRWRGPLFECPHCGKAAPAGDGAMTSPTVGNRPVGPERGEIRAF
jgi:hypothetical protein